MINVKNLHKSFKDHEILKGINVTIKQSEKVVILGPSGCGKSTFLRCLNLLEKPSSGQIFFNNIDITSKTVNINHVRAKMGMVFQNFNLFPHLTILKNITLAPLALKLKSYEETKNQALELLDRIGLADKANMYPNQLSGGQKQRIAIIRALAMDPKVLLFDEPTSALDPEMVNEVLSLIKELSKSNVTMLIVSHEINFAKEVATKILFMDDGLIIESSSPKDFFEKPKTQRAKNFIKNHQ